MLADEHEDDRRLADKIVSIYILKFDWWDCLCISWNLIGKENVTKGVFGCVAAFGKAVVGYNFLKSRFGKVVVRKPKVLYTRGFWKSFFPDEWTPHVIYIVVFSFLLAQQSRGWYGKKFGAYRMQTSIRAYPSQMCDAWMRRASDGRHARLEPQHDKGQLSSLVSAPTTRTKRSQRAGRLAFPPAATPLSPSRCRRDLPPYLDSIGS